MFTKFEIDVNCGGRRYAGNPDVRFFFPCQKDKLKTKKKVGGHAMVYVSHEVAKMLRWISGDKVDFYWDAECQRVGVKRSSTGMAKICSSAPGHKNKAQHHIHVNRQIADRLEEAWGKKSDEGYSVIASHEIIDDMLVLSFDRIA
jgi:hypothetical protein